MSDYSLTTVRLPPDSDHANAKAKSKEDAEEAGRQKELLSRVVRYEISLLRRLDQKQKRNLALGIGPAI